MTKTQDILDFKKCLLFILAFLLLMLSLITASAEYSLVAGRRLLCAVTSLVAEHGLPWWLRW